MTKIGTHLKSKKSKLINDELGDNIYEKSQVMLDHITAKFDSLRNHSAELVKHYDMSEELHKVFK